MNIPQQLKALEAYWMQQQVRQQGLPDRSAFGPLDLRPWLGHLAMIAVEPGSLDHASPRFRVTLSGSQMDDYRGGLSITNRYLDELCQGRTSTEPHFRRAMESRQPVSFVHDNSQYSILYGRIAKLLLPLSQDGSCVDRILVGAYALSETLPAPRRLMQPAALAA
jgi:hypothetical protein